MTKPKPPVPEPVATVAEDAAGFPVDVRMPHGDGPLILTDVRAGSRWEFMVEGGVARATTRDRLALLLAAGGAVHDPLPDGAGSQSPEGDASA